MGLWDSFTSAVDDATDTVSSAWDGATDSVSSWWNSTEDNEAPPKTYQQTAQGEKLAEGSVIPKVKTAQNNTGATVGKTGYASSNTPLYLIGGGVLLVVLLMMFMMMRGK